MMDSEYATIESLGILLMILWWGLIIWAFFAFIKWMKGDSKRKQETALDIAKERYAKGEIDAREFEVMKKSIIDSSK